MENNGVGGIGASYSRNGHAYRVVGHRRHHSAQLVVCDYECNFIFHRPICERRERNGHPTDGYKEVRG